MLWADLQTEIQHELLVDFGVQVVALRTGWHGDKVRTWLWEKILRRDMILSGSFILSADNAYLVSFVRFHFLFFGLTAMGLTGPVFQGPVLPPC